MFPWETALNPIFHSFRPTAQSGLEFLANRPVNDEVGGAVDGQQEVVQPDGDLEPLDWADTGALGVVLVQVGLVQGLGQVDDQPGEVADDVHHDYRG